MRTFHFFDVRDLLKLFQQKNPSTLLIPGTSFYEASLPILKNFDTHSEKDCDVYF